MLNRPSLWITTVAALAVGLSGCAQGSGTTAGTRPSRPSASTSTPSPASPTTGATKAPSGPRTVADLKSALLALDDMPPGFSIEPSAEGAEPSTAGEDKGGPASSKDPKCAALVKNINAKTTPGSRATARVALSGGQDGPSIDESIDALASKGAVAALQASFLSAISTCPEVVMSVEGQGSSTMTVSHVSAPRFGDHPAAARLTGMGGPLAGVEMTQVTAGVGDVVVAVTFLAAVPQDVDDGFEAAIGKAEDVLSSAGSGA